MTCTEVHPETNQVINEMLRYVMDSQYESVNVADIDIVRSTQFVEDYPRGVRTFLQLALVMECYACPSGDMKGTPQAMLLPGFCNNTPLWVTY